MTMVSWASKNSRAMGKLALYVGGGLALGTPLIKGATRLYNGGSFDDAAHETIYEAVGYNNRTGEMSRPQVRNAVIRTAIGGLAIVIARKL